MSDPIDSDMLNAQGADGVAVFKGQSDGESCVILVLYKDPREIQAHIALSAKYAEDIVRAMEKVLVVVREENHKKAVALEGKVH